jgi:hypothetical protein
VKQTVLDRDGVLFDTCQANLFSYLSASATLQLDVNEERLQIAIRLGLSISEFHEQVWPEIRNGQYDEIIREKARVFRNSLHLVELNPFWSSRIVHSPDLFYIATKASLESTRFLLDEFLPNFHISNVYSVQQSNFTDKVAILKHIARENSSNEVELVDDSVETVRLVVEAGYEAQLSPHFCRIHGNNA